MHTTLASVKSLRLFIHVTLACVTCYLVNSWRQLQINNLTNNRLWCLTKIPSRTSIKHNNHITIITENEEILGIKILLIVQESHNSNS